MPNPETLLLAVAGPIDWAQVGLRILHVGAAVLAAGGAFFQLLALHPVLGGLEDGPRKAIREAIVARWRNVVLPAIGILLLTGLVNYVVYKIPAYREHTAKGLYHGLFGLKFLLALVAFHAATVLTLPGAKGERYRDRAGLWLKILCTALAGTIVIACILRNITPAA